MIDYDACSGTGRWMLTVARVTYNEEKRISMSSANPAQVSQLFIYPLKSGRGIEVDRATVGDRGFEHDRRWLLVDEFGEFLTQRSLPRMALIDVALADGHLTFQAPEMPTLEVPLQPEANELLWVVVWSDRCQSLALGPQYDEWFSRFLGITCRLVYMPDETVRPVDPDYAGPEDRVGFADGFPFLVISEGSLEFLNQKLEQPVTMARFRPNIVVRGCKPHAEDHWARVQIGSVVFAGVKLCARCKLVMVDPQTAEVFPEPLRTLSHYRRREQGVMFGQNMLAAGRGTITVGDEVRED